MRSSRSPLRQCLGVLVVAGLTAAAPSAQAPGDLRFEVASIKQNLRVPGPDAPAVVRFSGDRATLLNQQLHTILRISYPEFAELRGGPSWVGRPGPPSPNDVRFDLLAKADGPATQEQFRLMLRALLADRFKLGFHAETTPETTWDLVLARSDGRLGPNLRLVEKSCQALRAEAAAGSDPCGARSGANALITGKMAVKGYPLAALGLIVKNDAGRTMADKTGLPADGFFDWELNWTPQMYQQVPAETARARGADPDGPSIFQAVQDQLGLKLVSGKGQKQVLVIDRVERPSED